MDTKLNENELVKKYRPLATAAGVGSMLGSGIIIGLSTTLAVWQDGLQLSNSQAGTISGVLTLMIGFGSLFGGRIAEHVGLIKTFNWINLFYGLGTLICVFSTNFAMLVVGIGIAGITSGIDLPVSLAVISRDAPDKSVNNKLVSYTQIFWQLGTFVSSVAAFIVSKVSGAMGARIVFGVLTVIAFFAWLWRLESPTFKKFHALGNEYWAKMDLENKDESKANNASVINVLFHQGKGKYMKFFIMIISYYCLWNLLANTWGQFGTFMLRKANASQSLATGAGLVISFCVMGVIAFFSKVSSNNKSRMSSFIVGAIITFASFILLGFFGTAVIGIILAQFSYQVGASLAGEAMYKVWTQESFPMGVRSSIQGIVNGTSRLLCALFAIVTPSLVMPGRIITTMWVFSVVVIIYAIIGVVMGRTQKKYGIDAK